mgnify:CR=1 FL=1
MKRAEPDISFAPAGIVVRIFVIYISKNSYGVIRTRRTVRPSIDNRVFSVIFRAF